MKSHSRFGLLLAVAVLFVASFSTGVFAQTHHTNHGKHMVGGHGSSHKGGHYVASSSSSSSKRHLVGGKGASHKGGHYVKK